MPALPEFRFVSVPSRGIIMSSNLKQKNDDKVNECDDDVLSRSSVLSRGSVKEGPWVQLGPKYLDEGKIPSDLDVMEVATASVVKRKAEKFPSTSPRDPQSDKKEKTKKRLASRSRSVRKSPDDETDISDVEFVPSSPGSLNEPAYRKSNRVLGLSPPIVDPRDAIQRCPSPSRLEDHNSADLWIVVQDLLKHVDQKRIASKNIKGPLNKEMKMGIELTRTVVENLFHRLQDQGDRTLLRRENLVLRDQLDDMKKKDEEKDSELRFLKKKSLCLLKKQVY